MSKMMKNFSKHRFLCADIMCQACRVHLKLPIGMYPTFGQMKEFFYWGFVFILEERRIK